MAQGVNPQTDLRSLTIAQVLAVAGPVVLSNAATPLQGAIDTAIVGNMGAAAPLAAVGVGASVFALLIGTLNFLKIGVSGQAAQALGRGDGAAGADILTRGLLLGAALGVVLILLQLPVIWGSLALFEASSETEAIAASYIAIRIWGAPAELMIFALLGWFAGRAQTRRLFEIQVLLSAINVGLNCLFVIGFGWGVDGVALGTVIAAYAALGYGLWRARAEVRASAAQWRPTRRRLFDRGEVVRLMLLNRDLFIRTALLVGAFTWMTRLGSQLGDDVLAANVVLWQFFLISAYGLDGFAIAAETFVGQALGARDARRLDQAFRLTGLAAAALAAVVSVVFVVFSAPLIDAFTSAPEVRRIARDYALWAALIPLAGVAAFALDGVFVGATRSRDMRDSMLLATAIYAPLSIYLADLYGNHGVWAAIWIWLLFRALTLAARYPALRRSVSADLAG